MTKTESGKLEGTWPYDIPKDRPTSGQVLDSQPFYSKEFEPNVWCTRCGRARQHYNQCVCGAP
jgi:hypothetical protein